MSGVQKDRVSGQRSELLTHLLHSLGGAVDPLVGLVQDQVYGLVKTLQSYHDANGKLMRHDDTMKTA